MDIKLKLSMQIFLLFLLFSISHLNGQEDIPKQCLLPFASGLCYGRFLYYHYNNQTKNCEEFVYGGCGGNANRFETLELCNKVCKFETPSKCLLKQERGPCRGAFPRYYYNAANKTCDSFIYGGCKGNENKFYLRNECLKTCATAPSFCRKPQEPGLCFAYFPRYFFNSETNQCEKFIYGGCGGNENNFETEKECQSTCFQ